MVTDKAFNQSVITRVLTTLDNKNVTRSKYGFIILFLWMYLCTNQIPYWRSSTISWMISSSTGATLTSCFGERRTANSTVLSWTQRCTCRVTGLFYSVPVGNNTSVCAYMFVCMLTGFPPRSIWGTCWTVTSSNWPSSDRGSMSFLPSRSCSKDTQNRLTHTYRKTQHWCHTEETTCGHPFAQRCMYKCEWIQI